MKRQRIITSYFFPENLLPWQPYNAYSCTSKIESLCVIKRTDRRNLLKLRHYMLSGMILKICKFWKKFCKADERINLLFPHCFQTFSPPTEFFQKIGINTRPIDQSWLSPKIWKTFTDRKQKCCRTKLEIWKKSRSTRSLFTHVPSCSRAESLNRVPTRAKPPAFYPAFFPFDRKVTKISWGESYRSHLY